MATSISAHPIDDLDFPIVSICPPKHTSTALYHDLVKAGNGSLTDEDKEALKQSAYDIFMRKSHKEYVQKMLATSNTVNLDQVYQGFQSLPKPYKHENGFETRIQNMNGTITTPWFGGDYAEEYYKTDKEIHMVLDLPEDVKDQVDSGFLIIELEMDMREDDDWLEHVIYKELKDGDVEDTFGYTLHMTGKSWSEAEAECQQEGGHLASVPSMEVNKEMEKLAGDNIVWVGGKKPAGEEWKWSDQSEFKLDTLMIMGAQENYGYDVCLSSAMGILSCLDLCLWPQPFICRVEPAPLKGRKTINLKYNKDQLNFSSFHVWYSYKAGSQQLLDNWEKKRMTGFKLSWSIENPSKTPTSNDSVQPVVQTPKYQEPLLVQMVKLARQLRMQNMTKEQILDWILLEKFQNIRILEERDTCPMGQVNFGYLDVTIAKLVASIDEEDVDGPAVDEEDIETGFELFHALAFCPRTTIQLHRFINNLISEESTRTTLQTYVNMLRSGAIKDFSSLILANQFYAILAIQLELQYGNVLIATSSSTQLQAMLDNDWPFLNNNSDLVKSCLQEIKDCDKITDVMTNLGDIPLPTPCIP